MSKYKVFIKLLSRIDVFPCTFPQRFFLSLFLCTSTASKVLLIIQITEDGHAVAHITAAFMVVHTCSLPQGARMRAHSPLEAKRTGSLRIVRRNARPPGRLSAADRSVSLTPGLPPIGKDGDKREASVVPRS